MTNKKWYERWYLTLFVIPVVLSLVSGLITWELIKVNILLSVCITLAIFILIISIEFFLYYRRQNIAMTDHDKIIVQRLINSLNIDNAEDSLDKQDSWYGYKHDHIIGFLDFIEDSKQLNNRLINNKLQKLIDNCMPALEAFNYSVGNNLFLSRNGTEWLVHPEYVLLDSKLRRGKSDELNKLADEAYLEVRKLIMELKRLNIIAPSEINTFV